MATATADTKEQIASPNGYGKALGEGEITRLLKTVQAAQFRKSETLVAADDSEFRPRSLVEIAFAAEQKRQQAEQVARQAEQETAQPESDSGAGDPGLQQTDETSGRADDMPPEATADTQSGDPVPSDPEQQDEQAARQQRAEEDEAVRQAAEEQGYKRGFEAGLEAARTAEPTEEELALRALKEQEKQKIVTRFHEAITAVASPQALDSTVLMEMIDQAVRQLAAERAGQEIAENPEGLVQRIKQLVDRVRSASQHVEVFVNPSDLSVLDNWMQGYPTPSGWRFTGDERLGHGDIRLVLGGVEIADMLTPNIVTPETEFTELAEQPFDSLTPAPADEPVASEVPVQDHPEKETDQAAAAPDHEPEAEQEPSLAIEAEPEDMAENEPKREDE